MGLTAVEPKVYDEVVEQLELLLEQARRGEVVGLTCAVERPGHKIYTWTDTQDAVLLLGHLARAMHNAQKLLDEAAGL